MLLRAVALFFVPAGLTNGEMIMATEIGSDRNAALLECPKFLRELVAKELAIPLRTLEAQIEANDEAAMERIEAVILWLGDRAKNLLNERLTSGGAS